MEEWLLSALAEKRKARALTDTARRVGIEPTRLSRIANQYVEPTTHEVEVLSAFLKPTAPAQPAPAPTPVAPTPVAAPAVAATPPARPAAAVANKPVAVAPAVAPKPVPSSARLSFGLGSMKVPVQNHQTDFVYRQELLKFIFAVRDWPTQHSHPLPGDFAYLQTLWNDAQKAIDAVNKRLYGADAKPTAIPPAPRAKTARRHHSSRFLFMQVAEERLPADVVANIRESAQEGLKGGAAQGFLEAFHLAAEAILDEEDFETLTEEAKQRAAQPEV